MKLYWWTRESLLPIPSFLRAVPPVDPATSPFAAEPVAVGVFRKMVKEGPQLPTDSDGFVISGERREVIPDDVSLQELTCGIYGQVSTANPLRILVAGDWTVGDDEKRWPKFNALRLEIAKTGSLPPLPPVDMVGTFMAYPTMASKPEDWIRALERFIAAPSHATTNAIGKGPKSLRYDSENAFQERHDDLPSP